MTATDRTSEQQDTATATPAATATGSGNAATAAFAQKDRSTATTSQDRVHTLVTELLTAAHEIIRRHRLSYAEYDALKAWLIRVGEHGEWPLFLDVWVEHVVEEVAHESREGSKGTIEGPYYVPGAPELPSHTALPMRPGERGTPLLFQGRVTSVDGTPLPGAVLEMWQADDDGYYSQYAPGLPEWNLRGTVLADAQGHFGIRTIEPAPYRIPTDGACGRLIAAAGWHAWRPAHLHLKVSAAGHERVTTQLYFEGDSHITDDIAHAVKPDLILTPAPATTGEGHEVTYDFTLDPA
ncbi:catechol 1,2-dioxygenase [Streptomyces sp. ODS28]|uniref:catechol 1,2-dioxygenase n=1 Tax=Streptomyces sp. ODS28 TaxID=3136688 RepID=UPI0031EA710A